MMRRLCAWLSFICVALNLSLFAILLAVPSIQAMNTQHFRGSLAVDGASRAAQVWQEFEKTLGKHQHQAILQISNLHFNEQCLFQVHVAPFLATGLVSFIMLEHERVFYACFSTESLELALSQPAQSRAPLAVRV